MNIAPANSIYAIFQVMAITLIVACSMWSAWRRVAPRSFRAAQAQLAAVLGASAFRALRTLGTRITPIQVASGAGCGSGGGCSSCGTCASGIKVTAPSTEHPLVFRPRPK